MIEQECKAAESRESYSSSDWLALDLLFVVNTLVVANVIYAGTGKSLSPSFPFCIIHLLSCTLCAF